MRLMRVLHKWLSLILGVQLLLWTVSGLVFAVLDRVRLMHLIAAESTIG